MKPICFFYLAIVSSLIISPFSAVFAEGSLSETCSRADEIIQTNLAVKAPGVEVTVAMDGKIIWSEGFGYADLAKKIPVIPSTRFRIGSVSKSLTAAGLAQLVEHGRIDLDTPIQKYIPDFPLKEFPITIRELTGHLSGIRNYHGREAFLDKPFPDLKTGLQIFENDPLMAKPGTKFIYSSYNYNVIGVVMEAAAQQDFLGYMSDNVFKPLGMTNTVPDYADAIDLHRTHFYEMTVSGKPIIAPNVNNSYKWPSGGFLSTTDDLARFGSALFQHGFLKPESLQLLFTSQTLTDGKPTHYGMGWFITRTAKFHNGDAIGGTSILMLIPATHTVVAIACNRGSFVFSDADNHKLIKQETSLHQATELSAIEIAKIFTTLHGNREEASSF